MAGFGDYAGPYLTMAMQNQRLPLEMMRAQSEMDAQRQNIATQQAQIPGIQAQGQIAQAQVPFATQAAQAKLQGSPFEQAQLAETLRSHRATESLTGQERAIQAVTADPIGMWPGIHNGGGSGSGEAAGGAPDWLKNIDPSKSPEDNLKQLPPLVRSNVQAVLDGQKPPPNPTGMSRDPMQRYIGMLLPNIDPSFNWMTYQQRHDGMKPYIAGLQSQNAINVAQGVQHLASLGGLMDSIPDAEKGKVTSLNRLTQWAQKNINGAENITNPQLAQQAVASEMARIFRGTGTMSEKEIEDWKEKFQSYKSADQIKGAIKTAADLIGGRIKGVESGWHAAADLPGRPAKDFMDRQAPNFYTDLSKLTGRSKDEMLGRGIAPPAVATPKALAPEDQAAISWAKANPADPRSAKILSLHGGL